MRHELPRCARITVTVYYRQAFLDTAHPYCAPVAESAVCGPRHMSHALLSASPVDVQCSKVRSYNVENALRVVYDAVMCDSARLARARNLTR